MKCRSWGSGSRLLQDWRIPSLAQSVHQLFNISNTNPTDAEQLLERMQDYSEEQWYESTTHN